MAWQDLLFLCGSLLTVVVLLPTLRNVDARIPLETSFPKCGLAVVYAVTFYSLGMTLSAVGLLATAVMWWLIACYRSPVGRSLVARLARARAPSADRTPVAETNTPLTHDGE